MIDGRDGGRDSVQAHLLRLAVILACVAGVATLLAGRGGPLAIPARPGALMDLVDPGRLLIDLVAGVALIATSAAMLAAGLARRLAVLALLSGAALTAAAVAGAPLSSLVVAAVADAVPAAMGVLLLALLLAFAEAARGTSVPWRAVAMLACIALPLALLQLASYDPLLDPACALDCGHVAAWLPLAPSVHVWLGRAEDLVVVATGLATVLVAARWLVKTRALRPQEITVAVGAGFAGLASLGIGLEWIVDSLGITGVSPDVARALVAIGWIVLAIGLGWWAARVLLVRVHIERATAEIAIATGARPVPAVLADALGDRSIDVVFAMPDGTGEIGADGSPAIPWAAGSGRAVTPVMHHDREIAAIRHPASVDARRVMAELSPTLLVALDNERLQAIELANLRLLRESRRRIVAAQDGERRRMERDLHDGAQQRILAIAMDLRLARSRAERDGDPGRAAVLLRAERLAFTALEELRRLARGVHPAILTQGGLGPALSSLAEDSAVPMTLTMDRGLRVPALIEAIAYQAVAEALDDAARRGATEVVVTIDSQAEGVAVAIESDGSAEPAALRMIDRVGAVGGRVTLESAADRSRIRAVMPCA